MRPLQRLLHLLTLLVLGCTTGEGAGDVTSDSLFVRDCYRGKFDLNPTFFGANPYGGDTLAIRIQRGDDLVEVSDGLSITVDGVTEIRGSSLGEAVAIGLPAGVAPPGMPLERRATLTPVSMALYLHASCNAQNGALYALCGSITFASLFSGDPNEEDSEARLTEASFTAVFGDPRDAATDDSSTTSETLAAVGGCDPAMLTDYSAQRLSVVEGRFRFFFQRGPPAQPFP